MYARFGNSNSPQLNYTFVGGNEHATYFLRTGFDRIEFEFFTTDNFDYDWRALFADAHYVIIPLQGRSVTSSPEGIQKYYKNQGADFSTFESAASFLI